MPMQPHSSLLLLAVFPSPIISQLLAPSSASGMQTSMKYGPRDSSLILRVTFGWNMRNLAYHRELGACSCANYHGRSIEGIWWWNIDVWYDDDGIFIVDGKKELRRNLSLNWKYFRNMQNRNLTFFFFFVPRKSMAYNWHPQR